jgi:hypothetical protein
MNLQEYARAMRLWWLWIHLNEKGRNRLQWELEKQKRHHGQLVLNASIECLERYLQREGE